LTSRPRLLLFGPGYCGTAIARAAVASGQDVIAAGRTDFGTAMEALRKATHLISTVPPDRGGDPILARYGDAVATAPALRWIGYLSATSVYGDRGGATVDEDSPPAPTNERGERRLAAEYAWEKAAAGRPLDLFRLAGIYGPGRSVFAALRRGEARRIVKPGHVFGRIHRDDIVAAVLAAMRNPPAGMRVLNLTDDAPAESAVVIEEAARLLGVPVPPALAFADAYADMSPIARSFWDENRQVLSRKTRTALGLAWRYPSYREGLAAILVQESGKG